MGKTDNNILLVIEGTYPWYRGGVSEWVYQYLVAFDEFNFTIIQIATDEFQNISLQNALYEVPDHVTQFIRIPPPQITADWQRDSSVWLSSYEDQILDYFKNTGCVHAANTGFAGWLGMTMAVRFDKPLILTEHALYWKEVQMGAVALECGYKIPGNRQGRNQISELFKDIASQIYQTSDHIISVSECNIEEQQLLGAQNVEYIPNGVASSWLKQEKKYSSHLTVGWIGRCAEMKNPLKFFDFAEVLGSDFNYLMMLSDAGEEALKRQVRKRGKYYENIKLIWNRPAAEFIDQMDALCITSHNESQPLVLFEALSRRVLPVGWEVGDVGDKYAIVVDKKNSIQSLAERVRYLWSQPEQWQQEVDRRFERFKKYHTWTAIFDRYKKKIKPYLNQQVSSIK